jgi:prephenate dehydrogenase
VDGADFTLSDKTVAILGLGLIGGSAGLALRGKAARVFGWNPRSAARALERKAVDEAAQTARACVSSADLVLLCCPLPATLSLLGEISPVLPAHCVVTDVGSVKSSIVTAADRFLPGRFIGGHPMAGSAESGIEAARADLFQGAPWLLTPTPSTDPDALQHVEGLVSAMGAIPRNCEASDHDRYAAAISHLPHWLAVGLAQTASDLIPEEWQSIAAGSFRDGTRVAASDTDLWTEVFTQNREPVLRALDQFESWSRSLRAALEAGDEANVKRILKSAREARPQVRG